MHRAIQASPQVEFYAAKIRDIAAHLVTLSTEPLPVLAEYSVQADGNFSLTDTSTVTDLRAACHQALHTISSGRAGTSVSVPHLHESRFRSGLLHHSAFTQQCQQTCAANPALLAVITQSRWPLISYLVPFSGVFEGKQLQAPVPPQHKDTNRPSCHRHQQFVTDTVAKYISQDAIFKWGASTETPPWLVMPLHVVDDKKLRLCFDAGFLNLFLKDMHFRLDTIIEMASIISPSTPTHLTSMDMKAWYLQSHLSPVSSILAGFEWQGMYYVFLHPAFGIKLSGFFCDQPATAVSDMCRANAMALFPPPRPTSHLAVGIRCTKYIDDWLLAVIQQFVGQYKSSATAMHLTNAVFIALCTLHGWTIGMVKSSLQAAHSQLWVGFVIDTFLHTFSLTEEKIQKVLSRRDECISHFQSASPSVRELDIQQWTGTVSSVALAFPGRAAAHHTKHANAALSTTTWPTVMTPEMHAEALFFDLLPQLNGTRKWRLQMHASMDMVRNATHDSSGDMWGFVLHLPDGNTMEVQGYWPQSCTNHHSVRCSLPHCQFHWAMHIKEPKSLILGIEQAGQAAQNIYLQSGTDSMVFRDAWVIGKSHDPVLTDVIQELWALIIPRNIVLDVYWLDTKSNWHADGLTRPTGTDKETRLMPHLFSIVSQSHGPFALDAMASAATAQGRPQLPYISRYHDSNALAVDIFLTPQLPAYGHCYCFPPHALMGPILALMLETQVTCTMIVVDKVFQKSRSAHITPPWWPLAMQSAQSVTLLAPPGTSATQAFHKGTWKACHPTPAATYAIHLPGSSSSSSTDQEQAATPTLQFGQQEIQLAKRFRHEAAQ